MWYQIFLVAAASACSTIEPSVDCVGSECTFRVAGDFVTRLSISPDGSVSVYSPHSLVHSGTLADTPVRHLGNHTGIWRIVYTDHPPESPPRVSLDTCPCSSQSFAMSCTGSACTADIPDTAKALIDQVRLKFKHPFQPTLSLTSGDAPIPNYHVAYYAYWGKDGVFDSGLRKVMGVVPLSTDITLHLGAQDASVEVHAGSCDSNPNTDIATHPLLYNVSVFDTVQFMMDVPRLMVATVPPEKKSRATHFRLRIYHNPDGDAAVTVDGTTITLPQQARHVTPWIPTQRTDWEGSVFINTTNIQNIHVLSLEILGDYVLDSCETLEWPVDQGRAVIATGNGAVQEAWVEANMLAVGDPRPSVTIETATQTLYATLVYTTLVPSQTLSVSTTVHPAPHSYGYTAHTWPIQFSDSVTINTAKLVTRVCACYTYVDPTPHPCIDGVCRYTLDTGGLPLVHIPGIRVRATPDNPSTWAGRGSIASIGMGTPYSDKSWYSRVYETAFTFSTPAAVNQTLDISVDAPGPSALEIQDVRAMLGTCNGVKPAHTAPDPYITHYASTVECRNRHGHVTLATDESSAPLVCTFADTHADRYAVRLEVHALPADPPARLRSPENHEYMVDFYRQSLSRYFDTSGPSGKWSVEFEQPVDISSLFLEYVYMPPPPSRGLVEIRLADCENIVLGEQQPTATCRVVVLGKRVSSYALRYRLDPVAQSGAWSSDVYLVRRVRPGHTEAAEQSLGIPGHQPYAHTQNLTAVSSGIGEWQFVLENKNPTLGGVNVTEMTLLLDAEDVHTRDTGDTRVGLIIGGIAAGTVVFGVIVVCAWYKSHPHYKRL